MADVGQGSDAGAAAGAGGGTILRQERTAPTRHEADGRLRAGVAAGLADHALLRQAALADHGNMGKGRPIQVEELLRTGLGAGAAERAFGGLERDFRLAVRQPDEPVRASFDTGAAPGARVDRSLGQPRRPEGDFLRSAATRSGNGVC